VRFGHLDVANARYNPKGKIRGEEVAFPVASRSADAVLLASVFTHMDEDHIFRYLSEARRVLKVGGRVLASFFLLEPQWAEAHAAGTTAYPMVHVRSPHCRYADAADPLFAIGYDLEWMVARVTELGLRLAEPPRLGQWARRAGGRDLAGLPGPGALIAPFTRPPGLGVRPRTWGSTPATAPSWRARRSPPRSWTSTRWTPTPTPSWPRWRGRPRPSGWPPSPCGRWRS
jgi:SAM-dependent methyltransferase